MEVKGRGSRSRMRLAHRRRGGLRTPGERRTGLFVDGWMNGWIGMGRWGVGWVKCVEGERSLAKLSRSTLGAVVTLVSTSAVDCSRLVVRGGRGVMQWCDGSRFLAMVH